jgi:hypothetical protein
MPCLITTGATKDCNYRLGGLRKLYFANITEIASYTDADLTDSFVEAIVMENPGTPFTFFEMEFERNTAVQSQELIVSSGQASVNHTVTFTLGKKDAPLIASLKDLSLADLVIVAEDASGGRCILGRDNGLRSTALTMTSGTAEADFSGGTFTFVGAQTEWAPILDPLFDITTIL